MRRVLMSLVLMVATSGCIHEWQRVTNPDPRTLVTESQPSHLRVALQDTTVLLVLEQPIAAGDSIRAILYRDLGAGSTSRTATTVAFDDITRTDVRRVDRSKTTGLHLVLWGTAATVAAVLWFVNTASNADCNGFFC